MNRPLTALFAALEALLVVGIGIGIPLVPLTVMWAVQYGLQIDWVVFWRAAVDIWLLGHGTDLRVTLDAATATRLGFPGAANPFLLNLAPLGFSLLTILLGARAGRRVAETPHARLGMLTTIVVFGVLSFVVTLTALYPLARPSIVQGALLPTLVFAIGIAAGAILSALRGQAATPGRPGPIRRWLVSWPSDLLVTVGVSLRGGVAAVSAVVAVAAVLVAVLFLGNYASLIALYEGAHAGILGGIAITVGQLAFLPNLVIWAVSWLVGPGFAIGTGSAITPFATSVGPLPAIPVLGALPTGHLAVGFLGLLVPVLAGFLAGVILRSRLVRSVAPDGRWRWLLLAGVGVGIAGGILLTLLAWASAGAAGPGRLVDVGPNPWLVGGVGALTIGVPAIIGLLTAGQRERETVPAPR
jgi:hypothetical protein